MQLRRLALQKVLARVGGEPAQPSEAAPSAEMARKRKGVAEREKEDVEDAPQQELPKVTESEGAKRALSGLDANARPTSSVKAAGSAAERPAAKRVARGAAAVGGLWSYPSLRKKAEAEAAAAASGVHGAGKQGAGPQQQPTAPAAKPMRQPAVAVASACPPTLTLRECGATATRANPNNTSEAQLLHSLLLVALHSSGEP